MTTTPPGPTGDSAGNPNPYGPPSGNEPASTPAPPPYGQPAPGQPPVYGQPAPGQPPAYGQSVPGQPPYSQPTTYGQPYGSYQAAAPKTAGMAIASLVTSLVGLFCGITSFVGIILGFVSLSQIKKTGQKGQGMAIAGIVIGVFGAIFVIYNWVADPFDLRAAGDLAAVVELAR